MAAEPHRRRMTWVPWLLAVVLLALGLLIGLDLLHCLLLAVACLAVSALVRAAGAGTGSPWPALPYGRRDGARRDVSTLTWTLMNRQGLLSGRGRERVAAVLREGLRLRGIDPATSSGRARARALLGTVGDWLADPSCQAPGPAELDVALTALETAPDPQRGKP